MFPQKHKITLGPLYARIHYLLVLGFFCFSFLLLAFANNPSTVEAATSDNLNFQGRLLNSNGSLVPDGLYNIEFKLYNVSSGGTALWTETYYDSNGITAGNDNRLRVVNGYFSANLGSINDTLTSSGINWDQEHWLTMNVGGSAQTATPTYDGEMNPRFKLTAVPYAFAAGALVGGGSSVTADQLVQLSPSSIQGTSSATSAIRVNQTGAGGLLQLQSSGTDVFSVAADGLMTSAGDGTFQGGGLTLGTATQTSTITLYDGSSNTATIGVVPLGANFTLNVPNLAAGTYEFCTTSGNCNGLGDILQGGNNYGTAVTIGTNDGYDVNLESNNITRVVIEADGDLAVDTNTLFVDAANNRVGIGTATPGYALDVVGDINTSGVIRIAGTSICTSTGCIVDPISGIQNQSATDQTADFRISGTGRANTSLTAPLVDSISGALNIGTTTATGVTIGGTANTTAVLLQGAAGATYTIGTSNNTGGITVGNSTATNTINIGSSTGASATQTINIGTSATASSTTNVNIGSAIAGLTTLQSQGGVAISTLGTADTDTVICRNSSNILSTCSSTFLTNTTGFVQGGNSFGTTAVLGTNDANGLNFEVNNVTVATISSTGATVFKNQTNSTTAFQIQNASGSSILNVDSTKSTVSITGANSYTTVGSELIVSQDFTNATYWTSCNGGAGGWSGTASNTTHNTGNTVACASTASNFPVTAGAKYKISFDVGGSTDRVSVKLGNSYIGDTNNYFYPGSTNTIYITASNTDPLTFYPDSASDVVISNVSVKQVTGGESVLTISNDDSTPAIELRAGGSGSANTYVGLQSGSVDYTGFANSGFGYYSLKSNSTGTYNSAFGHGSLLNNTTGFYNNSFGAESLTKNVSGFQNNAFGNRALKNNTSGYDNNAIGQDALTSNTTGYSNIGIGPDALNQNTTGYENVAIGQQSLYYTNGNGNTGIGVGSLYYNTTGTYNTALGYYAGYEDGSFRTSYNLQNASAIGAYSQVQQSDSIILGRSGSGSATTKIGIGTTAPTDLFSISPDIYDTGTAGTGGVSSTTVTGSGTTWTSNMVGMEIIFSNGVKATITAFSSTTSITVTPAITVDDGTDYRIHNRAFYVTSTGSVGIRTSTNSATGFNVQNASGSALFNIDTSSSNISIGTSSTGTTTINSPNTVVGASAGSGLFTNNGATVNSTLAVANDSDGGSLGGTPGSPLTAAQSVDIYTSISVNQTTASQTITLPTPTASTTYGRILYLSNIGTASFTFGTSTINPGTTATLIWSNTNSGASWQFAGADANGILNQNSADQTANFRISGTGQANTSFISPILDSTAGLSVGTSTATSLTLGRSGATTTLQGSSIALNSDTINSNQATVNFLNSTSTTINAFGAATSITIGATTGTLNLNGGVVLGDATSDLITVNGIIQGGNPLVFEGSSADANETTLSITNPTADRTITLPNETGTVCTNATGGVCSALSFYVQNQSASDQTADYRISGTGRANTSLTTPLVDSISGALSIGTSTATGVTIGGTTNTTSLLLQGAAGATYTIGTSNNTGGITIGNSTDTNTIAIGSSAGASATQTINIGTSATASSTTNTTIGSTIGSSSTTLQSGTGNVNFNASTAQFTEVTGTRSLGVQTRTTNVAGTNLTISAGTAGSGASAFTGGTLTLQGGAAGGTGNANGGSITISGGAGTGTGVQGVVGLSTSAFTASSTVNFGTSNTLNSFLANATNSYGTVPVNATAIGLTLTIDLPTTTTVGRIIYITAVNGSNDFTMVLSGTSVSIAMKANSTATLIYNGTGWTAAGASSSTDLQSAYNNTLTSAGGAEIVLAASGGAADGLTIRNNSTSPITGALLEAQTSIGSNLFSVNNNAIEYASNGGSETAGASSTTFPANTWSASDTGGTQATVTRTITAGEFATGVAAVKVVTTGATTANQGAANQIILNGGAVTALTSSLVYNVSFAVKGTTNFSTLDIVYSKDGTNTATTSCATGKTVTQSVWSRIDCSFTAPTSGITTANAIFIRQSNSNTVAKTFYIDNLSVSINANTSHSADGSVDSALGTNWTQYDADGGAGTTTLARDTTTIYDTSGSVSDVTTAHINEGMRNNMPITPSVSTQYLVTFYAKLLSGTFTDITVGFLPAGGNSAPVAAQLCTDYNTQTLSTTAWTKITCIITTPSSGISDPDLVIYQPTATARTFYVDALTITLNTNNSSNVQIGGGRNGGPSTLFTLDRSNGAPIAANNDAYLGSMYYDTSTGRIQCYESDGWGACGAAPDNIVNLNPEYAGAVLNGTGVGTMTADFCSEQAGVLNVNTALCDSGQAKNYYKWTSPQATQQTYSIYVTYQLPATFNGFASDDTVQLVARTDSLTNAAVTYEMYKSTGSAVTQCGTGETTVVTTADTWQSVGVNGNESTGCSFNSSSASNFVIFKINVKANSNANAYVSTLSFTTTGR